jgi:3-hydroxymyristoyl/3-hydroxydecanoyl-(acyl carrier protein) dehydratase
MKNMNEQIKACALEPAKQTERGWERTYVFGSSFTGFQGHFPGTPILPAIIQIIAVRLAISEQRQKELQITQIARTKFMKTITSDVPVTMIWSVKEQGGSLKAKCTLETQNEAASSISMTLTARRG